MLYLLSGTKGQFNVRWDKENERILLTSGTTYETVGGELADSSTAVEKIGNPPRRSCSTARKIALDGYIINGNNYYKLRDIGKAIGFDVDFDNASSTVLVKPQATIPAMTRMQTVVIRAIPARIPRRPLPIRPAIRSTAPAGDTASA